MILVDTSVWVDHFRAGIERLSLALESGAVLMHPFVIGELACGNLRNRDRVLVDLARLPLIAQARHSDVMQLVGGRRLWNRGIGWVDAHLVASAMIGDCVLWTRDRRLMNVARALHIAHA